MIIDAHHHLWNYNQEEYGWMDDSMSVLKRDYLPVELERAKILYQNAIDCYQLKNEN